LAHEDRAHVPEGTVWIFCPQNKKDHERDYHKVFNHNNFFVWWVKQLIPNLKQPSLIIMDNAAYHKVMPPDVPKLNVKKELLQRYLESRNVHFEKNETVPMLRVKVKVRRKLDFSLCELVVKMHGHQVLFTPPHHSDFQPIELLWAKIKGNIGRRYYKGITMSVLLQRLEEQFEYAKHDEFWAESMEGMIETSVLIAQSYYEQEMQEDQDAEDGEGDTESEAENEEEDTDTEDDESGEEAEVVEAV
jgi:transposase